MTAESSKILIHPNFATTFAAGDPFPGLVKQHRTNGIRFAGKYCNEPKRYILKSAHMSRNDRRLFDQATPPCHALSSSREGLTSEIYALEHNPFCCSFRAFSSIFSELSSQSFSGPQKLFSARAFCSLLFRFIFTDWVRPQCGPDPGKDIPQCGAHTSASLPSLADRIQTAPSIR